MGADYGDGDPILTGVLDEADANSDLDVSSEVKSGTGGGGGGGGGGGQLGEKQETLKTDQTIYT